MVYFKGDVHLTYLFAKGNKGTLTQFPIPHSHKAAGFWFPSKLRCTPINPPQKYLIVQFLANLDY